MAQHVQQSADIQQWVNRRIGASRFGDVIWEFDDQVPGGAVRRIRWDFEMPDGSRFTDAKWNQIRFGIQILLYSLHTSRSQGGNLTGRTIITLFQSIKRLIEFMFCNQIMEFGELDPFTVEQYMKFLLGQSFDGQKVIDGARTNLVDLAPRGASHDGLPDQDIHTFYEADTPEIAEEIDELSDEDINENQMAVWRIRDAVQLFGYIFEESAVLQSEGFTALPEHPFRGLSAKQAVAQYVDVVIERIPPVPDSLYLPTTSKLMEWLGIPAQDIIKLQSAYLEVMSEYGPEERELLRAVIHNFRFSSIPGQDTPWRRPIAVSETDKDNVFVQLKRLVSELATAGIMTIQALVGQRQSELLSLQALPLNPETNLPYCIEIQSSLDGLYDVFLIKGRLFKTKKTSEEALWTAGMRLKGSDELPPPIQAIMVLYELYRPWREASGLNDLCINFANCGGVLPDIRKKDCCIPKAAISLNDELNAWIQKYVDVPAEYKDWRVTTTQWRKSFATYMIRSHPGLLRAVSEHFHHMSVAMTNNAYVSKDVKMRGLLESAAVKETAKAMHQMITGKVRIGGKMAELVRERKAIIMARLMGKTEAEQLTELEEVVKVANVRIYACDWGWCLFRSATSRCNQHKGTDALLKSKGPDLAKRCPDTCHSCKNLAVTDEHRIYWEERQRKYEQHAQEHLAAGNIGAAAVAQERVDQARSVLRLMDLTMDISEGGM